jgi:hypothetical protein
VHVRDALATLASVARESWRLASDRLRPQSELPHRVTEITPEWLTRALQRDCPGARVRAVAMQERHAGTTERARLALTYAAGGDGAPPPAAVFVKLAPTHTATR